MPKRNLYPTLCTDCGTVVPAGHGRPLRANGRWVTSCAALQWAQPADDGGEACDAVRDAALVQYGSHNGRRRY